MISEYEITNHDFNKLVKTDWWKQYWYVFSWEITDYRRIFFLIFSEFVRKNSLALNYEFFWIMLFQIEFVISNSEIRYNDIFSDLL